MTTERPTVSAKGQPLYGRCPRALLTNPDISRDARLLWTIIEDRTSKEGDMPWPSKATLAREMGCKERAISNWLSELVEAGWLTVHAVPGRTNHYEIDWYGQGGNATPVHADAPMHDGAPPLAPPCTPPGTTMHPKKNQEEEPIKNPPPQSRARQEGPVDNPGGVGVDEVTRQTVAAIVRTLGLGTLQRTQLTEPVTQALRTASPQEVHDRAVAGGMKDVRNPAKVIAHRLQPRPVKAAK